MANTLLIFEAGLRDGREFWLRDLKQAGYRLVLVQPWAMTWESPYIDSYLQCRLNSWSATERQRVVEFAKEHSVVGVLALNEGTVPFAQDLNLALNLPSLCLGDIRSLRNKVSMRRRVALSGLGQPAFQVIHGHADVSIETLRFKLPVVVKPAEMMASIGVIRVDSSAALSNAIENARVVDFDGEDLRYHYGFTRDVLIEEYVTGDEYSLESIVQDGCLIDFFVTKKFKCAEPYFDEIGHMASPHISTNLKTSFQVFLSELHSALGIASAVTHTEVKVQSDRILLIEIACRPGGDLIPLIHSLSADFNFPVETARVLSGERIQSDWRDHNLRSAVAVFFPHDRDAFRADQAWFEEALEDARIYEFKFDQSSELKANAGLHTVRRGKVVFSGTSDVETERLLQRMVTMSGGI